MLSRKKLKITKKTNSEEDSKQNVPNQIVKSKAQTHQINNNCHIHDLVQAFSYVENGDLNLLYS